MAGMYFIAVVQVKICRENGASAWVSAAAFYPNEDVTENADHSNLFFFQKGLRILLHIPSNESSIHPVTTRGKPLAR